MESKFKKVVNECLANIADSKSSLTESTNTELIADLAAISAEVKALPNALKQAGVDGDVDAISTIAQRLDVIKATVTELSGVGEVEGLDDLEGDIEAIEGGVVELETEIDAEIDTDLDIVADEEVVGDEEAGDVFDEFDTADETEIEGEELEDGDEEELEEGEEVLEEGDEEPEGEELEEGEEVLEESPKKACKTKAKKK